MENLIRIFANMNEKNKISVVINTYNAEQRLEQVLEAVKDFDEILICDMESTDHTLDIAQKHGCRILTFERKQYNIVEPAREYAIHEAQNEWVLVVDADEIVTSELKDFLYDIIQKDNCPDGLFIPRKNFFMGRFMRYFYPDNEEQLAFIHLANDDIERIVNKTNQYTDNELKHRQDKNYGLRALIIRPLWRFIRNYFLKCGFRDGIPGFIRATLDAFYQFVLVAKIIEKRYQNK